MNHFAECYYCVCTACNRSKCPWKHRIYMHCTACQERGSRVPRLHCDCFEHYLKTRRFRFKRLSGSPSAHFGSYILVSDRGVFVGNYDKLSQLQKITAVQVGKTVAKSITLM